MQQHHQTTFNYIITLVTYFALGYAVNLLLLSYAPNLRSHPHFHAAMTVVTYLTVFFTVALIAALVTRRP